MILNIILWIIILAYVIYQFYLFFRRNRVSKVLSVEDFKSGMRTAQIVDLREAKDFDAGHILGARNIPYSQLRQRFSELRSDLPVYLYDQGRSSSNRAVLFLSKNSFDKLYILKSGFKSWDGKTKKKKYQ